LNVLHKLQTFGGLLVSALAAADRGHTSFLIRHLTHILLLCQMPFAAPAADDMISFDAAPAAGGSSAGNTAAAAAAAAAPSEQQLAAQMDELLLSGQPPAAKQQ
jgi:hypothetical protein